MRFRAAARARCRFGWKWRTAPSSWRIRDNGRGLPAGLNVERTKGLGLRIVHVLARRLRATLNFENASGARITLTFPLEPAAEPQ